MIARNLSRRLNQLETRFAATEEPFRMAIQFINPETKRIVNSLVIDGNREDWRHPTKHVPKSTALRAVAVDVS